jgi:hypothetical protein
MPIYPTKTFDYNFDNPACYPGSGTTVTDLQGNLNLAFVGTPTFSSSTGNGSYFSFDASNVTSNHLASAFSATLNGSYNCSMSFCIRATDLNIAVYGGINSDTLTSQNTFRISRITDQYWYSAIGYAGENVTTVATPVNKWVVVTVTSDYTNNQIKTYINGSLVKTDGYTTTYSFSDAQVILGFLNSTPYFSTSLGDSDIKAFSFWKNVVLTAPQVLDVASEFTQYTSIVSSYDFSDALCYPGSGSTVFDLAGSLDLPIDGATFGGTGQSKYFSFDGTNDKIGVNSGITGVGSTFSINIWVERAGEPVYGTLFAGGYVDPSGKGPVFYYPTDVSGTFSASFNYGVGLVESTSNPLNTWQMWTYTCDGTTSKLYKNGTFFGSDTQDAGTWDTGAFWLGVQIGGTANYFQGKIAILDIYNSSLGSTAILDNYNTQESRFITPTPPAPPTLIGSYDFSDPACWPGSGNTVFDLTAENNDLLINIVSFGGTGQSKYASLNGDTSWMYKTPFSASGSTFNSDQFTISLWHNYGTQGTFGGVSYIAMGGVTASGQGPSIVVDNSDQKVRGVFGAEITAGGWVTGIANTVNTWHMTTLVADGTDFLLYQDGALTGSTTQAGQWGGSNLVFGRPSANPTGPAEGLFGHKWGGLLGIAEVYSGALGSTDISDLYDLQQPRFYPAPPPPENLVASFDFSDPACYPGTGNTIFDLSNTGLDLPIVNATYGGTGQSKYFEFNGSNAHIGKNGVTGLGNTFSVSMWSKYPAAATSQMFQFSAGTYDASQGAGPMNGVNSPSTGFVDFSFNDGIGATNFASTSDEWHNYTFTADGTTVKAYLDGTLAGSVAQGVGSWDNGGLYLGVPITTGGNFFPGYYFNGQIATFDVYNEALNSGAVTDIYDNTENRFLPAPPPAPASNVGGRQFAQGFNG